MTEQEYNAYQRVLTIIDDQLALEEHQRRNHATFEAIEFTRVDAYRKIVKTLKGHDIFTRASSASSPSG